MTDLDLAIIKPILHTQAIEAFQEGDAEGVLCCMDNHNCLAFVFDNIKALRERGIYEQALAQAFTGTRTNHANWNEDVIAFLFAAADRERLIAAGSPLPPGDTFTLYRGVSGHGRARRIRGFSWTDSLDVACWFAARLAHLAHPAVYSANLRRDEILCYLIDRQEREFIARPGSVERVNLPADEIRASYDRHAGEIKKRNDDFLRSIKRR